MYFQPFLAEFSSRCICHILFTQSSADGHLGCFYFGPVMNNATINILVYMFLFKYQVSILLGINLGMELLGHMTNLFNFLRNCQTVLYSIHIILKQCMNFPVLPYISQPFHIFAKPPFPLWPSSWV